MLETLEDAQTFLSEIHQDFYGKGNSLYRRKKISSFSTLLPKLIQGFILPNTNTNTKEYQLKTTDDPLHSILVEIYKLTFIDNCLIPDYQLVLPLIKDSPDLPQFNSDFGEYLHGALTDLISNCRKLNNYLFLLELLDEMCKKLPKIALQFFHLAFPVIFEIGSITTILPFLQWLETKPLEIWSPISSFFKYLSMYIIPNHNKILTSGTSKLPTISTILSLFETLLSIQPRYFIKPQKTTLKVKTPGSKIAFSSMNPIIRSIAKLFNDPSKCHPFISNLFIAIGQLRLLPSFFDWFLLLEKNYPISFFHNFLKTDWNTHVFTSSPTLSYSFEILKILHTRFKFNIPTTTFFLSNFLCHTAFDTQFLTPSLFGVKSTTTLKCKFTLPDGPVPSPDVNPPQPNASTNPETLTIDWFSLLSSFTTNANANATPLDSKELYSVLHLDFIISSALAFWNPPLPSNSFPFGQFPSFLFGSSSPNSNSDLFLKLFDRVSNENCFILFRHVLTFPFLVQNPNLLKETISKQWNTISSNYQNLLIPLIVHGLSAQFLTTLDIYHTFDISIFTLIPPALYISSLIKRVHKEVYLPNTLCTTDEFNSWKSYRPTLLKNYSKTSTKTKKQNKLSFNSIFTHILVAISTKPRYLSQIPLNLGILLLEIVFSKPENYKNLSETTITSLFSLVPLWFHPKLVSIIISSNSIEHMTHFIEIMFSWCLRTPFLIPPDFQIPKQILLQMTQNDKVYDILIKLHDPFLNLKQFRSFDAKWFQSCQLQSIIFPIIGDTQNTDFTRFPIFQSLAEHEPVFHSLFSSTFCSNTDFNSPFDFGAFLTTLEHIKIFKQRQIHILYGCTMFKSIFQLDKSLIEPPVPKVPKVPNTVSNTLSSYTQNGEKLVQLCLEHKCGFSIILASLFESNSDRNWTFLSALISQVINLQSLYGATLLAHSLTPDFVAYSKHLTNNSSDQSSSRDLRVSWRIRAISLHLRKIYSIFYNSLTRIDNIQNDPILTGHALDAMYRLVNVPITRVRLGNTEEEGVEWITETEAILLLDLWSHFINVINGSNTDNVPTTAMDWEIITTITNVIQALLSKHFVIFPSISSIFISFSTSLLDLFIIGIDNPKSKFFLDSTKRIFDIITDHSVSFINIMPYIIKNILSKHVYLEKVHGAKFKSLFGYKMWLSTVSYPMTIIQQRQKNMILSGTSLMEQRAFQTLVSIPSKNRNRGRR